MSILTSLPLILVSSLGLRIIFFLFGLYQDANMPLPYTDIDYYVFTDAAKFVSRGLSPFLRATYRYTPLLSWVLIPTSYDSHPLWFSYGKFIFILCDLLTGYISLINLPSSDKYLSLIWFYNPMVITISTRGSSESLLTSFILLTIHFLISSQRNDKSNPVKLIISGLLLGLSVHLKIYPFIYTSTFLLFLDSSQSLWTPITFKRLIFGFASLFSFFGLSYWMYKEYTYEYLYEAFIYHLVRLDHRHNFSVYNILLYLTSFDDSETLSIEKMAFIPQLGLSLIVIPLTFKRGFQLKNYQVKSNILFRILFIQTFVFITFNKVCTSQYFIWYLCLLPQFISTTNISLRRGVILVAGWLITQGLWLFNGWRLEFRGDLNVFTLGLFTSSSLFFMWNIYMICNFIEDVQIQINKEMILETGKEI